MADQTVGSEVGRGDQRTERLVNEVRKRGAQRQHAHVDFRVPEYVPEEQDGACNVIDQHLHDQDAPAMKTAGQVVVQHLKLLGR